MKSLANLSLLLLVGASAAIAQEPPPGDGPRGSSALTAGEVRYDAVGYATIDDLGGISAASTVLPVGSYAEVTELAGGRTIVVGIVDGRVAPGRVIALSSGAATALGLSGDLSGIRVRKVTPTPQDVVQLRGGQAASFRAEAPPALLIALRKKLPPVPPRRATARIDKPVPKPTPTPVATVAVATKPTPKPASTPTPTPKPSSTPKPVVTPPPARPVAATPAKPVGAGYVVQVAALSDAKRAAEVAKAVGGTVITGPPIWRVRLGPYPDSATAARAKADAARKGYAGGPITRLP